MNLPPEPPGLPESTRENFRRLLAFPLDTPARMLQGLDRHMHNILQALPEYPHLNEGQARQIVARLKHMLAYEPAHTPELHQHWIQTAARYFFLNDDGAHDWATAGGFDDDAEVVAAVERALTSGTS